MDDTPSDRRTLAELAKAAAEEAARAGGGGCPDCGCRHMDVVKTYYLKGGEKKQARRCRHCGRPETGLYFGIFVRD